MVFKRKTPRYHASGEVPPARTQLALLRRDAAMLRLAKILYQECAHTGSRETRGVLTTQAGASWLRRAAMVVRMRMRMRHAPRAVQRVRRHMIARAPVWFVHARRTLHAPLRASLTLSLSRQYTATRTPFKGCRCMTTQQHPWAAPRGSALQLAYMPVLPRESLTLSSAQAATNARSCCGSRATVVHAHPTRG